MDASVITVDGPSGTGKSSVSRAVAHRASIPHLDTGAFYRAATLAVVRSGVDLNDPEAVVGVVKTVRLDQSEGRMFLDEEDVSDDIRGDDVTTAVSLVSAYPEIRSILVGYQREWVARHGSRAVVEGRDIGSVVFPDAGLKIYLDARPEVRALRRALQAGDDLDRVRADQARRDLFDSTRSTSPLTVPNGAVVVDTSDLGFDEVVDYILGLIPRES